LSGRKVQLHLLRHADAGDAMTWPGPDERRPLSAKGRAQAERLGEFLASNGFAPDAILTSPLLRAAETAEIVAAALHVVARTDPRLAGGLALDDIETILHDAGDPARPVLVGHDPDFSGLLAELVSGPLGATIGVRMRKGAIACIAGERPLRPGGAELRWLVTPDLLGR
jgi:phosphohistidine phosphatase